MDNKKDELKKKLEEVNKIYLKENIKKLQEFEKNLISPSLKEKQELYNQSFESLESSMNKILEKDIPNKDKYFDTYSQIAENLSSSNDLSINTQKILSLTENLNKEQFKYDMDRLIIEQPKLYNTTNYGQIITDSLKQQRDSLVLVVTHLEENNSLLKKQIKDHNITSKEIIEENKKLATEQIKLLENQVINSEKSFTQQLSDSKKTLYITIGIAVVSIAIAIGSTIWSVNKTEEIYIKENVSGDNQHNQLKEILENNSNKDLIFEDKQLKVLNQILESIKENKLSEKK